MSSEWQKLPLSECLEALIDYRGKTPTKTQSGIPLITAKIIKKGRIEKPTEYVSFNDYESWMRRGIPIEGDVVMTTEAPLGEVAQIGKDKIALAQRVITLRGKSGLLDSTYLLYLLQTEEMQEQLKSRATGTTVLGIKQSELRKIIVMLPPVRLQKNISFILSNIDKRIDLLHESNVTLEAIAQALFKSWFVDFDPVRAKAEGREPEGIDAETAALFPDSFEESELGLVPKGWGNGVLGDIAQTVRTQRQARELDASMCYVGLEHIPRKSLSLLNWSDAEGLKSSKTCFSSGDILFGKLRPYFHKVVIAPFDGVCSTDILVCKSKLLAFYGVVLMHLFSEPLINYATRLSNGARMPRISWKDLAAYPIVMPPEDIARSFQNTIEPLLQGMMANTNQVKTLANLRDTLLPRLISGQLKLPTCAATPELAK
jgi:type I restriction enzyme S subunit